MAAVIGSRAFRDAAKSVNYVNWVSFSLKAGKTRAGALSELFSMPANFGKS